MDKYLYARMKIINQIKKPLLYKENKNIYHKKKINNMINKNIKMKYGGEQIYQLIIVNEILVFICLLILKIFVSKWEKQKIIQRK